MKKLQKIISITFAFLTIGAMIFTTSCGDKAPTPSEQHTHTYIKTDIPSTCTTKGYIEYKCSCGDFYTENPQNIIPHNGTGSCTMCNLDYYEELKQLIIANGVQASNSMYYFAGKTRSDENTEQSTYICFDPGSFDISVGLRWEYSIGNLLMTCDFMFFIKHPSESTGIKTGKYDWILRMTYNTTETYSSGTINGNTFSSMTTSLSMTSNYDSSTAEIAADFAKDTITDAFIPLLKISNNNIVPSNYGFVNYSL